MEVLCPIKGPLPAPSCPPEELAPLLGLLRENRPVSEPTTLPRGTLLPDGRLDLCKQGLGAEGCWAVTEALAGHKFVRSLLLGTNGIGDEGAAAVAGLLAHNRALEVVYLGCNGIREEGIERLCAAVAGAAAVSGLWLKRNPIGPGGLRAVAQLVRGGGVRVLDLTNVCPGEAGWVEVAGALCEAPNRVEQLYLGGNGLGPGAGAPLGRLAATNRALRGLYLDVGRLGDEGASRLAAGLAANRGLRELSLASNGMGPAGVAAVALALCGHPELAWLDLGLSPSTRVLGCSGNRVRGEAVVALAELVETAPRLVELDLARTGIDATGLALLASAAERNPALTRVVYDGPRVPVLERLLAGRQTSRPATPRPDVELVRSVYR